LQVPAPSQLGAVSVEPTQVEAPHEVPAASGRQLPVAQLEQAPAHALEQQTPPTQLPLAHSRQPGVQQSAAAQVAPLPRRGRHAPPNEQ
jgi:hypothetical protein